MGKWLVLIILGLIFPPKADGQKFEIGLSAGLIKELVERDTKGHNKCDTCGSKPKAYRSCDIKYNNGEIAEVTQCHQQEYLPELRITANYCEHYIMNNNKLAYLLTQFENVPLEKIIASHDNNPSNKKIGELYFSDDYEHYSKIYLSTGGLSTIEWRQTIVSELPENLQSFIDAKRAAIREKKKADKAIANRKREHGDMGVAAANDQAYPSKGYVIRHSIAGRNIVLHPDAKAEPVLKEDGKVIIRVAVDREGAIVNSNVISASNPIVKELALKSLPSIRFNKSATAPPEQFGNITFQFKGAKP